MKNSSASEEMAATSEELSAQAASLQQTVSFFTLDERLSGRSSSVSPASSAVSQKTQKTIEAPVEEKKKEVTLDMGDDKGDFERY